MIPFGDWLPDQAALENPGASHILNVIPFRAHYRPLRGLSVLTNALDNRAQGAIATQDSAGTVKVYAGDKNKLYRLTTGDTWTDASKTGSAPIYATPDDGHWRFSQFGSLAIGVNGIDAAQKIDITSGTQFSNLGGSPPIARYTAVVRDFLLFGNLSGEQNAVHWSAFNNAEGWTIGTDQSDKQTFPDQGAVNGIVGGETGYVFLERAIYQMLATGDDFVFQFDKIEDDRGLIAPGALVRVGQQIFFLSHDGFYVMAGGGATPIGNEKVDKAFFSDLNQNYLYRVSGAADPINKMIMWSYASTNSIDGTPDKVIMFNWADGKWSQGDLAVDLLFTFLSEGQTLEDLDSISASLDALAFSLDSRVWTGGALSLGAFGTAKTMGTLSGSTLAATLETSEAQLIPPGRSLARDVTPLVDASAATVKIGTRERQADAVSYSPAYAMETSGICRTRDSGRFHRVKVEIPAATEWTKAQGVDFDATPAGMR